LKVVGLIPEIVVVVVKVSDWNQLLN